MNILLLISALALGSILGIWNLNFTTFAQANPTYQDETPNNNTIKSNDIESKAAATTSNLPPNLPSDSIPSAQSVYDTGVMSLSTSAKGAIIFIPDESHHPPGDQKTISPKNPNYLPATLEIPEGTEVAFLH